MKKILVFSALFFLGLFHFEANAADKLPNRLNSCQALCLQPATGVCYYNGPQASSPVSCTGTSDASQVLQCIMNTGIHCIGKY